MTNTTKLLNYRKLREQHRARAFVYVDGTGLANLRSSFLAMDMTENYLHFMALNELREGEIGVKNAYLERVVETRRMSAMNRGMDGLIKVFARAPLFLRQASS